jgi:hypothetical protein
MTYPTKKFHVSDLVVDERCQARECVQPEVVQEYAEAYRAKTDMPPIDVFMVDGKPWVVDGMHRWAAHAAAGVAWARCRIVGTGTTAEAIYRAQAANKGHGLRRSNADKRKAIRNCLENEIGIEQSSRVLAEHLDVGKDLVSEVRLAWDAERRQVTETPPEVSRQVAETPPEVSRVGKDGKRYPVKRAPKAPKTRVVPEPEDVGHDYPVESDDPLPHEPELADLPQGDKSPMPSYGPELERVATAIGRLRVECRRATLPNSILQSVESGLKSVESTLRFAVPETCPRCSGKRCMHCRQRGWVEKSEGDGLRASVKAAAR